MGRDEEEEDDRETLIPQNHIHIEEEGASILTPTSLSPRRRPFSSTFHIGNDSTTTTTTAAAARQFFDFSNSNSNSNNKKRLLIFVPIILFLVFYIFTTDNIRNIFSSANLPTFSSSTSSSNSNNARIRESELQALYLLRQQQLSLLTLWNRTTPNNTNTNTNASLFFADLRSSILRQISLNKETQQLLFSAHRPNANLSDDTSTAGCTRKPDLTLSHRTTIQWNPNPNKFLFPICLSGQMSNHLICLEKHMFFAALLNRVLVIPSPKLDYQYNKVLDIDHINTCVQKKVAITFDDFALIQNNRPHIDKFMCYFALPQPCYVDEEHLKKLKHDLGVSIGGKLEPLWKNEDVKKPTQKTVQQVQAKFSSTNDDVIAIGDVFYADVEKHWVMQPHGPLAHNCSTLIEPSRLIMLTAQRFIQTFLGRNFIALHFRRHGFLKFCNAKKPSCFFPIPQVADCIARIVEKSSAQVIYLSTDAAESETDLLQSLIVVNGKSIPLVKRPPRNGAEKWDALLYRHGLEGDSQVEAMLDKTICAMSSVFVGSSGSTFTEDILRLRKDWGSASSCDEYMCQGENPNFIADDE
ncbi:hypothetical protein ACFE04_004020 [Oxalis oulophora]